MIEFHSKRNKVYLTADNLIYKVYGSVESYNREVVNLFKANGHHSPTLLSCDKDLKSAVFTYTEGELLVDAYAKATPEGARILADMLAETIVDIHYAMDSTIICDENFKNYIISNGKCVRIDFEDCREGTLEEWAGEISAFATLYENFEGVKQAFISELYSKLNLDLAKFCSYYESNLRLLSERWHMLFPEKSFVDICQAVSKVL